MIESVLAQTVADWEMIIVENGSTDQGPAIAMQYAAKDSRIRFLEAPPNVRGPGAARNLGLQNASGEWALFLDADDLLDPNYLECQLKCFRKYPKATVLVGRCREMRNGATSQERENPSVWLGSKQAILDFSIACAPWPVHSALVRRSLFTKTDPWPAQLDPYPSEDSAFWFPLLLKAEVAWSPEAVAVYRHEEGMGRNQTPDIQPWIDGLLKIISHNVDALRATGRGPTAEQARSCLRILEEKFWIAKRTHREQAALAALREANHWLQRSGKNSPGLALRAALGIPTALFLIKLTQRLSLSRLARAFHP